MTASAEMRLAERGIYVSESFVFTDAPNAIVAIASAGLFVGIIPIHRESKPVRSCVFHPREAPLNRFHRGMSFVIGVPRPPSEPYPQRAYRRDLNVGRTSRDA